MKNKVQQRKMMRLIWVLKDEGFGYLHVGIGCSIEGCPSRGTMLEQSDGEAMLL